MLLNSMLETSTISKIVEHGIESFERLFWRSSLKFSKERKNNEIIYLLMASLSWPDYLNTFCTYCCVISFDFSFGTFNIFWAFRTWKWKGLLKIYEFVTERDLIFNYDKPLFNGVVREEIRIRQTHSIIPFIVFCLLSNTSNATGLDIHWHDPGKLLDFWYAEETERQNLQFLNINTL